MTYRGLSSVCTKLEPVRSRSKEILELNVLQKKDVASRTESKNLDNFTNCKCANVVELVFR